MLKIPILMLSIPVVATLAGGFAAIRLDRYRPALIAVGAGLLLGAAFLDLLPEAISIGAGMGMHVEQILGLTLLFFLVFSVIEGGLDAWARKRGAHDGARKATGRIAGAMMIFHSFRDGMAIGAAFTASHAAGYAVATGIAAHDFGDGMNTVILTTAGEKARLSDYVFLIVDAIAPFLGGLLTVWWLMSSRHAAMLLALAAGFFLQMATSDFLPQLRAERRTFPVLGVCAGAAVIWITNLLISPR